MFSKAKRSIRKIPFLHRLYDRISFNNSFRVEKALLNMNHQNSNRHPSILHFTTNKSASQHVMSVLQRCASNVGMSHANLNGYAFNTSLPFIDKMSEDEFAKYSFVFKPTGYLYSAFGGMIDGIPDFHKYKVVLMLRDPRDVLVSNYYSIAYSHPFPLEGTRRKTFAEKRKKAIETSLDDFVRGQSAWVKDVYNCYYNLLIKRYSIDRYYFTSYEAMTMDYSKWLKQLLGYLELDIPSLLFDALVGENERSRPVKEDIHRAKRLGRFGDYLNKLSPETISWLNEDLKEVISVFGYSKAGLPKIQSDG